MFDPGEHEPLTGARWDATRARAFISDVIRETDAAYDPDRRWPLHPEDQYELEPASYHGIYCGTAGTTWALTRLAQRYGVALHHDYAEGIARCEDSYRANPIGTETVVPSYFMGTVGIMLARYAITGDAAILNRLTAEMLANVGNPTREAFWGSPGTALAALLLRERGGDARYDDVLRRVQDELWETWEKAGGTGGLLWEQDLYGHRLRYVGAGHGAIGNLAPLVHAVDLLSAERQALLRERVPALLEAYVIRDGDAANWVERGAPPFGNRMQWCHGSPGVIIGLAAYPSHDERVERLLEAGGEGIWRAGPLRKGPTLCHGTAGNGFALLRLAWRTGDGRWRSRAESFAAHAIEQVARWRGTFGIPAFSLWTGELGVALYVDAVLRNDPSILTLDAM